jgi:hypothetical protein
MIDCKITDSDASDFVLFNKSLKSLERVPHWNGPVRPVNQKQVQIIGTQLFQRTVTLLDYIFET